MAVVCVCVWQRSHGNGISSLPGYEEQTDHLSSSRGPDEIDLFIQIISGLNVFYEPDFIYFPSWERKLELRVSYFMWSVLLIHSNINGCLEVVNRLVTVIQNYICCFWWVNLKHDFFLCAKFSIFSKETEFWLRVFIPALAVGSHHMFTLERLS